MEKGACCERQKKGFHCVVQWFLRSRFFSIHRPHAGGCGFSISASILIRGKSLDVVQDTVKPRPTPADR